MGWADFRKRLAQRFTLPVVKLLARTGVSPNALTVLGCLVVLGASALVALGRPVTGGVAIVAAGLFDLLDGALARFTGRTTTFGAVLDSTLDRLSDAAPLLGIIFLYGAHPLYTWLAGLSLVGSFLVSYVRARAEALGLAGKEGLLTRPERVALLALGLLLSPVDHALAVALGITAVFSFFTAGQRLASVWRQTKGK